MSTEDRALDDATPRWAEHPAPAPLTVLQQFVNSHGYSGRVDHLRSAVTAEAWFESHGIVASTTTADAHRLVTIREALRSELGTHGGREDLSPDPIRVERVVVDPVLSWRRVDGVLMVVGIGVGVDGFVNELAAAVVQASLNGDWRRLKVCANDECQVAFWDRTKNHSGRFCSSTGCANRVRQRAFRRRATTA